MIGDQVRRARVGEGGIIGCDVIAELHRKGARVDVIREDRVDHRLPFAQVIDLPSAAPLPMRDEQRVGDVNIRVRGRIRSFVRVGPTLDLAPRHQARIILARMPLIEAVKAVEIFFRLGIMPSHEGRDEHPVSHGLGDGDHIGAGFRIALVKGHVKLPWSFRGDQALSLPDIVKRRRLLIQRGLRDGCGLDAPRRIARVLRERARCILRQRGNAGEAHREQRRVEDSNKARCRLHADAVVFQRALTLASPAGAST